VSVDRVRYGWSIGSTDFIRCEPSRQRSTALIRYNEPLGSLLTSGVHRETDERAGFFPDRLPREIEARERTPSPTVKGLKFAPSGTKCHSVSSYTI
jgi:hypothetical protein